jgi:hypothetical protein
MTRFFMSILLLAALSSSARAQPGVGYPRLGLYGTVGPRHSIWELPELSAYPFLDAQGNVVDSVAAWHAKFDVVVLEASQTLDRPDILQAIRRHNSQVRIIGFVDGCQVWWNPWTDSINYPDTLNCLRRKLWNSVVNTNGFLYSKRYGDYYNPNRTGRDPMWLPSWYMVDLSNLATVDSLVSILARDVIGSGLYDGLFVDLIGETMAWTAGVDSFDYERAGYPSAEAYEQAWKVGHRRYAAGLRAAAPPGFTITLNWAVPDEKAWVNGSMREGFPFQGGGTWQTNMFAVFEEERTYVQPPAQWLNTQCSPCSDSLAANNQRKLRFGLGSATLCEAYHSISENDRPSSTQRWNWWYDEYAVDRATGRASRRREDTGWLGTAMGPWYQMIWAGTGPRRGHEPRFREQRDGRLGGLDRRVGRGHRGPGHDHRCDGARLGPRPSAQRGRRQLVRRLPDHRYADHAGGAELLSDLLGEGLEAAPHHGQCGRDGHVLRAEHPGRGHGVAPLPADPGPERAVRRTVASLPRRRRR